MPIYEYRCQGCGNEFEVRQKITEGPLTKCDKCSGKLDKLVSRSAFVLKGTGWYKTDYADKKDTNPSTAEPSAQTPAPKDNAACGACPANGAKSEA